jgi:hypothetical protein
VAIALEKMFITKMNEEKRKILKNKLWWPLICTP